MEGPTSARRGRGGGSSARGGYNQSRGRGRGGRGGGRGGYSGGGHAFDDAAASSSPMFFPISYQDTSSFQLPTTAPGASSIAVRAPHPQPASHPTKLPRMANPTASAGVKQQRHQHVEPKEDELTTESDADDFDHSEDYVEDEANIFDMAEEAMVDGKKFAALREQQAAQAKAGLGLLREAKQPAQTRNSQQPRHKPLVVVTKAQREAELLAAQENGALPLEPAHSKVNRAARRAEKRAAFAEEQGDHSVFAPAENFVPPHPHPQPQPMTRKERALQRAKDAAAQMRAAGQGPPAHHHDAQGQQRPKSARAPKNDGQPQQPPPSQKHQKNNAPRAHAYNGNNQQQQPPPQQSRNNQTNGTPNRNARTFFPEHLSAGVMKAGLAQGIYLQGTLRAVGSNAFVTVNGLQRDVFIDGKKNKNRAFDGDVVCIQIVGHETPPPGAVYEEATSSRAGPQSKAASQSYRGRSGPGKHAALEASLDALILNSEAAEDAKIEEEKKHGKAAKGKGQQPRSEEKKDSVDDEQPADDSSSDRVRRNPAAAALLSTLYPSVQHRGVVVGILQAKFPAFRCPGVLKPFSATLALFVPLDKKTPYALVSERSWPQEFAKVYKEYLREAEVKKKEKAQALKARKIKGNFPEQGDSSNVVLETSPVDDEPEVDAMTAAGSPDSVVLDSHIYIALFQPWLATDRQPFARIEENLGLSGDIASETEALLVANGVDYDHDGKFDQTVLDEVASYSRQAGEAWKIPEEEIARRRDFRDQSQWRIVTIDPTTARDLDDAIHARRLANDVIECGVHIADVSYFVKPNTALDAEAKHRATTIYLVQKAIPMLPPILCEQLCSLNPNVDRLAYSCVFHLDGKTGKLLRDHPDAWFGKSVIRTCCRLNYEAAQLLMEFDRSAIPQGRDLQEQDFTGDLAKYMARDHPYRPVDACSFQQLLDDMQLLHGVAMKRRADRFEVGSLTLSNVKLQFRLDADRNPTGFVTYPLYDSNRVVEEMMLLANLLVAEQCVKFCRDIALLRRHPPPNETSMKKVNQACQELGYDIDATTAGSLQKSLDQYQGIFVGRKHGVGDAEGTMEAGTIPLRQVLEPLCTKPMQLAKYFCTGTLDDPKEWAHFALHFPEYTHFTSPIRRYADVVVHRVLTFALQCERWKKANDQQPKGATTPATDKQLRRPRPPPELNQDEVAAIADTCNTRKANAKKAQEQSSKVYLCDFLLRHHAEVPLSSEAVIIDMFSVVGHADPSFEILCPSMGIEKKIHLNELLKQGKILHADIEPKDQPEASKPGQLPSGHGKNNRPATGASVVDPSAAVAVPAPTPKSAKRLHITWPDQTTNVYSIFDAIDVELVVRRGPPMDLDAFCISPATAKERSEKAKAIEPEASPPPAAAPAAAFVLAPDQLVPEAEADFMED